MGKSWELHAYIHTNFNWSFEFPRGLLRIDYLNNNILIYKFKANWKPNKNKKKIRKKERSSEWEKVDTSK